MIGRKEDAGTSRLVRILLIVSMGVLAACTTTSTGAQEPLTDQQRTWLDDNGPIVVGVPSSIAPAVIIDEEGDVNGGWAWELTQLAGLKVGADVTARVYGTPADVVAALEAGEVDLVTGLSTRPDLQAFATQSTALSWTPVVFAVGPERSSVANVDDLVGLTVTTIPGSPIEARLAEDFAHLEYVRADTLLDALIQVYDGTIDAWAGPLAITSFQLSRQGRDAPLRVVGEPLSIVEVGVWGRDGPALQIIEAGRQRTTDTELSVIHVRWTGFDLTDPADDELPGWLIPMLWGLLTVALVFGAFILLLRRQVAARTLEVQRANTSLTELNAQLERTVAERTKGLAEANEQLVRSNDGLARFANRAAHDLRGPLAAMLGYAQLASRPDLPAKTLKVSLETIVTSTRRMADLVSEMLQDASELVPTPNATIPSAELATWLAEFISIEVDRHNATVSLAADRAHVDLPVTDLKQLLLNMVGNAMKHSGRPQVAIDVTMSRFDGPPARWTVTVDDDGQGIPADQRELVLERGYRTESAGELGSGLGLAACTETIRALGGTVEVSESPSGGARMAFTLPATKAKATSTTSDASATTTDNPVIDLSQPN